MAKRFGVASGPRGVTSGQHVFSRVPSATLPRSRFDRSCGRRQTVQDAGLLCPVFVDEVLPGDTFSMRPTFFGRMATPLHPVMENVYLDVFWFFVPNRLLWEHWEEMNGEQANPTDTTDYLVPIQTSPAGGYDFDTLHDYMGIRPDVAGIEHSALPFRAYNLIWNTWFRDQNLQDSVVVDLDDGPDDPADYVLLRRGKRHDYFTSCLPWPQKGTAVELPLGLSAPVTGVAVASGVPTFRGPGGGTTRNLEFDAGLSTDTLWSGGSNTGDAEWVDPALDVTGTADLSSATAATINQIREAFQIQKMFERDARGGSRYTEILRSHFGVISPDARLQRPEFLGGGTLRVNFNPVAKTTIVNSSSDAIGDLGAFVTFSGTPQGFHKSFVEHGIVLGLVSFRADLNYQQGLERMWSRRDRFEFYWPAFAHLGEQAVLNKEIFVQGTAGGADDDEVFGYQERWAEYRYKPSQICGQLRSDNPTSLDTWHLAQDFSDVPLLNEAFIQETPPMSRIMAVQEGPQFLLDCWFQYRCARVMPTYSVPGFIDRF